MPARSLDHLLRDAVRRWGSRPFLVPGAPPQTGDDPRSHPRLVDDGPLLAYADFDRRVDAVAGGLSDQGVIRGSVVSAILADPRDLLHVWFATARLGAVFMPLNPALTPAEVATVTARTPVAVFITGDETSSGAVSGLKPVAVASLLEPGAKQQKVSMAAASDPLSILWTSGTTGAPKGCLLTHESYVRPAEEFRRWMDTNPDDRFFACLPLFHLAGQAFVAAAVASGASVVLVSRFSGSRFWDQVTVSGATMFRHLGEMLAVLCRQPPHPEERSHRLRAAYGGGASQRVARTFYERFGVRVVEGYGLTETNTVLRNELSRAKPGSIGRPTPYAEVRVAGEDGRELGPGEIGEIQVRRGSVTMIGYIGDPEATDRAFVDGWYRTGDLGWRDADEHFYFVGRTKDIVRRRGENIVAVEVEEVLNRNPAVAASAVVPVPADDGGEECKAFVVQSKATTVDELVAWCRSSLAGFKVPRFFEICDELPRTPTNKVDKWELRALGTLGGQCHEVLLSDGVAR